MIDDKVSEARQLDELKQIGAWIHRSSRTDELRKVHARIELFSKDLDKGLSEPRARYFYLKGVLYTKAARSGQHGWYSSSTESLHYACELFKDAFDVIEGLQQSDSENPELKLLMKSCVYEAKVAECTLSSWGSSIDPKLALETTCLSKQEQSMIARHLRHRHLLRSRF